MSGSTASLAVSAVAIRPREAAPAITRTAGALGSVEAVVPDLADVKGQPVARLALEVAAAGGHHLMFVGPPGAGKTMLARRLRSLLPDLDPATGLAVTRVQSAAGLPLPSGGLVRRPPFRAPHHSASMAALRAAIERNLLRVRIGRPTTLGG